MRYDYGRYYKKLTLALIFISTLTLRLTQPDDRMEIIFSETDPNLSPSPRLNASHSPNLALALALDLALALPLPGDRRGGGEQISRSFRPLSHTLVVRRV